VVAAGTEANGGTAEVTSGRGKGRGGCCEAAGGGSTFPNPPVRDACLPTAAVGPVVSTSDGATGSERGSGTMSPSGWWSRVGWTGPM
jgi:hypothetical protein